MLTGKYCFFPSKNVFGVLEWVKQPWWPRLWTWCAVLTDPNYDSPKNSVGYKSRSWLQFVYWNSFEYLALLITYDAVTPNSIVYFFLLILCFPSITSNQNIYLLYASKSFLNVVPNDSGIIMIKHKFVNSLILVVLLFVKNKKFSNIEIQPLKIDTYLTLACTSSCSHQRWGNIMHV